jgi:hypothetical protein
MWRQIFFKGSPFVFFGLGWVWGYAHFDRGSGRRVSTRRRSAIGLFELLSDLSVPRDLIRFGVYTVVYNFKVSVFAFTAEQYQSWVFAKGLF